MEVGFYTVWPAETMSVSPYGISVFLPQCYMFHMYVGVRAGGGIGDQIEDPAGDEYEIYRIIFDITFFFFVIVILLAIIQGEQFCTQNSEDLNLVFECIF